MKKFDAIIFDIDNVLIDTRRSYLDAIRYTVEYYLTSGPVPFFKKNRSSREPQILSPEDVHQFKLLGGFNDDWDCCYGLLIYLLSLRVQKKTVEQLKEQINLEGFSQRIRERPLKVSGMVKLLGVKDLVMIEKIARIFQEIYLGKNLFQTTERRKAVYWKKRGLIEKEKLVFKQDILKKLKERGLTLGIATGRPKFEALYSLKRFGILEYFQAVTTMDEVKRAEQLMKRSLRKPHPYSLIVTAKKMGAKKKFLYVGDLPDDILAAHEAKSTLDICSAAFPSLAAQAQKTLEEIQKVKPDFILTRPRQIFSILEKA